MTMTESLVSLNVKISAEEKRLSDASVNFHFDATRSFHLKIGKIK